MKISPSILSADFGNLNQEIKTIEKEVDWIHVDVMDGHFVPNITIGAPVVSCIKSIKTLDCHLMIKNPEKYINDFIKAGAGTISTHIELGEQSVEKCLNITKESNLLYGLALNPETSVEKIFKFLDKIYYILVMSVHPGFGGQSFISDVLEKVKIIKKKKANLEIQIDGGINEKTAVEAKKAGVCNLVAGSFIFKAKDRIKAINL